MPQSPHEKVAVVFGVEETGLRVWLFEFLALPGGIYVDKMQ